MKFEKKTDRDRQEYVVGLFCNTYKCKPKDLGEFSEIDYLLYKDRKPYFYLEIKGVKKKPMTNTGQVKVSLRKLVALQEKYVKTKIPTIICWAFTDGIAWQRVDELTGLVGWGGRKARTGSTYDEELMFTMNISKCKKHEYVNNEIS